jgi:hypothetical protein
VFGAFLGRKNEKAEQRMQIWRFWRSRKKKNGMLKKSMRAFAHCNALRRCAALSLLTCFYLMKASSVQWASKQWGP